MPHRQVNRRGLSDGLAEGFTMEFCIQSRLGALHASRARSIVVLGREGRYRGSMPMDANRANCNGARSDEGANE